MKFIKSHIRLFEILFCIFSIFLAVMIALYVAGDQNKNTINSAFGLSGSKTISAEGEDGEAAEEVDTEYFPPTYSSDAYLIAAYEEACREVEEEGLVLLSNDGALPLAKGSNVSLFGQGAKDFQFESGGSSSTGNDYASLKDALEYQNRLDVNDDLWDYMDTIYRDNRPTGETIYGGNTYGSTSGYTINEAPFSEYQASNAFRSGDAAIMVVSRASAEGTDITAAQPSGTLSGRNKKDPREYGEDGSFLSLSVDEVDILKNLTTMKSSGQISSIIVLLNTSATVQLDFLDREGIDVDACMWIGNVGSHGAYAVAEALVGDVNPSGRSVDTYLKDNFSSPAMYSWGCNDERSASQSYLNASEMGLDELHCNNKFAVYVEGIYVGYRYFETRYEDTVMGTGNTESYDYNKDVAFPFGYGESYSKFEYDNFKVTPNYGDEEETEVVSYTVSVDVTNTSDVPGKEVVEVYLQKPYSDYDKVNNVETASVELAGYGKTEELGENETENVKITVNKEQLRSYDTDGAGTYILDEGDYYLTVATDSHDAVNNILAAKEYTEEDGMDAAGDKSLVACILTTTEVDTEIFATSSETGTEIGNELGSMDLNRYENSGDNGTTYVSRSDWAGTFPTTNEKITVGDAMYQDLQSDWISYDEEAKNYTKPKYGKNNGMTLFMLRGKDYNDEDWDTLLDQMTYAEQAEFVTLGYHVTGAVESIAKPATVDENGPTAVIGSVTGYCLPSEGIWAATFNDKLIGRIGELFGDDCIMSGIQGFYAPGVNIHRTGFIGRSHEYFSEDPYLSGMASVAEIKGIQSRGVIAYVKHFAFNDIDTDRNGISIWLNEQSAREIYLLPFEYSMRPSMGNSHAVMTSFNRAGCRWSSSCSELMIDIARGEWGFDGYYITDMSTSNGAVYMTYYDGIMNGTNLYDGTPADSLSGSKYNNNYFYYMLRDSCHRILYNVVNYSAIMNGMDASTRVKVVTNWWQVLIIVLLVIAVVGTVAAIVFYVLAEVFSRKDKGDDGNGGGGVRPRDADDDYDTSEGVISQKDVE